MGDPIVMEVAGDKELRRALGRLSNVERRSAFRRPLRDAMKQIQAAALSRVPRRTGKLAKSLKVRAGRKSRTGPSIILIGQGANAKKPPKGKGKRRSRATRAVQFTGDTFYGGFVEYGTKRQPPQPFIRPAFDERIGQTERTIRDGLMAEIERIWQTK